MEEPEKMWRRHSNKLFNVQEIVCHILIILIVCSDFVNFVREKLSIYSSIKVYCRILVLVPIALFDFNLITFWKKNRFLEMLLSEEILVVVKID